MKAGLAEINLSALKICVGESKEEIGSGVTTKN